MAINRAPWTALVDDDGSNLTGSIWNKAAIKTVLLDPIDAQISTGTWTATDASGAGLALTSPYPNRYWKFDKMVVVTGNVQYPTTASGVQVKIGGLPFANGGSPGGLYLLYAAMTGTLRVDAGTVMQFWKTDGTPRANSEVSGALFYFTGTYLTA
jgi:hypothetical protein